MIPTLLIKVLLCGSLLAQAPSSSKINEQVRKDLETATAKLNVQREQVGVEKIKLSTVLTKAQLEIEAKRRKVRLAQLSSVDRKQLLKQLEDSGYESAQEVQLFNEALKTYGVQFSAQLLPGEDYEDQLAGVFSKQFDRNALLQQRFKALEAGLDRLDSMIGGTVIDANATDFEARVVEGKVAVFGPLQWFSSDSGSQSGSLILSKSKRVNELQPSNQEQAKQLVAGKEAVPSIDVTGGKAAAIASIDNSVFTMIKKGGTWVYPILTLALIAFICALFKLLQLSAMKTPRSGWLKELLVKRAEQPETVEQYVQQLRHPVAEVLPHCIAAASSGAEVVEEILYEQLIDVRDKLKKWLPFIAITAATAPLLGLLGTVSGLIKTFNRITIEGTGEAQTFAGGIAEALITTMFGLVVAIPAFIIHALLARKSKGIEQTTERIGLGFVNALRKETKTK